MPMVVAIAVKTTGPILEMGCGFYSTLILHEICKVQGRVLVTMEEKADWFDKFCDLKSKLHQFYFVKNKNWAAMSLIDELKWGMVFVDHAPGERRKDDIVRLKDQAEFLVIHDSEEAGYKYESAFNQFSHRFDYTRVRPWTTVLSNKYDLNFLRDVP